MKKKLLFLLFFTSFTVVFHSQSKKNKRGKIKKLLFLLFFITLSNLTFAQTKTIKNVSKQHSLKLGLKLTGQWNGLTNKGFDALNSELQKNTINILPNEFTTEGLSFHIWVNRRTGFEIGIHKIISKLEEGVTIINSGIPFLSGRQAKLVCFTEIFRKNRFSIVASGGFSTSEFVFEIVDLQPQLNSFSNLLTNASLVRTVGFQSTGISAFEGALGFDYQVVKAEKSTLAIGIKGGYNYQPLKQKNFTKWVTKRTNIPVYSVPSIALDSYFIQFYAAFNFHIPIHFN